MLGIVTLALDQVFLENVCCMKSTGIYIYKAINFHPNNADCLEISVSAEVRMRGVIRVHLRLSAV